MERRVLVGAHLRQHHQHPMRAAPTLLQRADVGGEQVRRDRKPAGDPNLTGDDIREAAWPL